MVQRIHERFTRAGLERIGYKVGVVDMKMLPVCHVTMKWGVLFDPPRQIDLRVFDDTGGNAKVTDFSTAWYIGSVYPEKGKIGEFTFQDVTLPHRARFAFDPVVSTSVSIHLEKLFTMYWELELPMRDVKNIGGFTSPKDAWKKALQIEMIPAMKKKLVSDIGVPIMDEVQ